MSAIDKVVISNLSALTTKYTDAGVDAIKAALARLVEADASRGHRTRIVEIDDADQMAAFGGHPVIAPNDEVGAKQAVDAIYDTVSPDYILLLDGPDVIPHVALNPVSGISDGDLSIESDLPYASNAPFSRDANAFLGVTRVVGRLPACRGTSDGETLSKLISLSASHAPRLSGGHGTFFSISADAWRISTQLSLKALFGNHDGLHLAPKDAHAGIDPRLGELVHFINCHGAQADWRFYGEGGGKVPVAMESNLVEPHVVGGTVAAAECCYGAELYDVGLTGGQQPICMSYLLRGAAAFMGSTNTSYGPAASNGEADLICQYFLESVLLGASSGRAMLQARQRFIATQVMSSPTNLKTLAQFVLLGDPSLQAVLVDVPSGHAKTMPSLVPDLGAGSIDKRSARKSRRLALESEGTALAAAATTLGKEVTVSDGLKSRLTEFAKAKGFSGDMKAFEVAGGAEVTAASKRLGGRQSVAVVTERAREPAVAASGVELPSYRVLTAHVLDDGLTRVDISESR